MRIPIRTSRTARWSRRLGSFALPLTVIPILLHRSGIMDSDTFALVGVTALMTAAIAVFLGLVAMVRLWFSGDRGWGRAVSGILLGTACLTPLAYAGYAATRYPLVHDVSTNAQHPPSLEMFPADRAYTTDQQAVAQAFPGVSTRDYPISLRSAYNIAKRLVQARGWVVEKDIGPGLDTNSAEIHAIANTALGWRDEVAIRLRGASENVSVDARSASPGHSFDLGRNGTRLEALLADFDAAAAKSAGAPAAVTESAPVPAVRNGDPGL